MCWLLLFLISITLNVTNIYRTSIFQFSVSELPLTSYLISSASWELPGIIWHYTAAVLSTHDLLSSSHLVPGVSSHCWHSDSSWVLFSSWFYFPASYNSTRSGHSVFSWHIVPETKSTVIWDNRLNRIKGAGWQCGVARSIQADLKVWLRRL